MSDQIIALILTLAIFTLLAVWVPILDILQGALQYLRVTKASYVPRGAPVVRPVKGDCPEGEEDDKYLRLDASDLIGKPEIETVESIT